MRSRLFRLLLCLFFLPSAALADRLADGVTALGVLSDGQTQTVYAFGDFTLGATWGQWGVELGAFGVVGRLHETYANLRYQSHNATYRLGFPRPAFDAVAPSALTAIMPRQALNDIGRSRSYATYGTMVRSDFLPYGASIAIGDTIYSLHGVPHHDVMIAGIGLSRPVGSITYDIAAEAVVSPDATAINTKARASYAIGRTTLGVSVFDARANAQPRMAEVFGTHRMESGTGLSGVLRVASDGTRDLTLGLNQPLTDLFDLQIAAQHTDLGDRYMRAAIALEF